ncbi:uncharacterized protein LOC144451383 [Glandiceps talaboti]
MANTKFCTRILLIGLILGIVQNIGNAQIDRSSCYVPTYKDTPAIPKYNNKYGINCPLCRPGESMMATCTADQEKPKCEQCPVGFYMKYFNHCPRCQYCSERCDRKHQRVKKECSPTTARECICADRTYYAGDTCTPYTKCQPGEMVHRRGSPVRNTRCTSCPKGTFNPKESLSRTCQLHTVCPGKIKKKGNKKRDNVCLITTTHVAMTETIDLNIPATTESKKAETVSLQFTSTDVPPNVGKDSKCCGSDDLTATEKPTAQYLRLVSLLTKTTTVVSTDVSTQIKNLVTAISATNQDLSSQTEMLEVDEQIAKNGQESDTSTTALNVSVASTDLSIDIPETLELKIDTTGSTTKSEMLPHDNAPTVPIQAELSNVRVPAASNEPEIERRITISEDPSQTQSMEPTPILDVNSQPDTLLNEKKKLSSLSTGVMLSKVDNRDETSKNEVHNVEDYPLQNYTSSHFVTLRNIGITTAVVSAILLVIGFAILFKWKRCQRLCKNETSSHTHTKSAIANIQGNANEAIIGSTNTFREPAELSNPDVHIPCQNKASQSRNSQDLTRRRKSSSKEFKKKIGKPETSIVWILKNDKSLENVFIHIAHFINRLYYLAFLRNLSQPLHNARIQDIQCDYSKHGQIEIIYQCLLKWKCEVGSESVKIEWILKALEESNCAALAEEIQRDFCTCGSVVSLGK